MPLIKSKSPEAFKTNVKTLMDDVGKSPHVQSKDQALAIAYATKARARADGGGVHIGPISSTVPGRTDDHPIDVAAGSYVLPAECVSNLGENNTNAGMVKLHHVMSGGPDAIRRFFSATPNRASGGRSTGGIGTPVPINAAGGEFVIPPKMVSVIGGGDVKRGHAILDAWVMKRRKNHIKTLQGLAPPAKD